MFSFTPSLLTPVLPCREQHRGMGNWKFWSAHNSSSLLLLPPHTSPLLQCGSSTGCRGYLLCCEAPPPPPFFHLSVHTAVTHPSFPSSFSIIFHPFLNTLPLRCHHPACRAQLCPAVGWLQTEGTDCVWHRTVTASPHSPLSSLAPAAPITSTTLPPAASTGRKQNGYFPSIFSFHFLALVSRSILHYLEINLFLFCFISSLLSCM